MPRMVVIVLLSALPFCAAAAPSAPAGELEAARAALAAGSPAAALDRLRPLAEQGDGTAALLIGRMADNGWGMPENAAAAWGWYKRAAELGEVEGMLRAADGLDWGRGVAADAGQAYALYQRAAQAGDARARGRLGVMALEGRGRKVNQTEAMAWLRQAAQADDPDALAALDGLAERGQALPAPAGSATPADAAGRRVLAELQQAMAGLPGLRLDGEATVAGRADGSLLVTLPKLSLAVGGFEARLGTVRVVVRDIAADHAEVALLLPGHVVVTAEDQPVATLTLSGTALGGRWSFDRHRFDGLSGAAVAAELEIRRAIRLSLRDLGLDTQFSGGAGPGLAAGERASAAEVTLSLGLGSQRLRATVERLAWRGEAKGLAENLAGWPLPAARLLLSAETPAVAGTLTADHVVFGPPGQPRLSADRLEAAAELEPLRQGLAAARFRYRQDGLGDRLAPPLAARLAAAINAQNWPLAALGDAAAAMADRLGALALQPGAGRNAAPVAPEAVLGTAAATLAADLGKAGTALRLTEASAGGAGWAATASGRGVVDGDGVGWTVDAEIEGLDALLAQPQGIDPAAAQALRQAVKPASGAAGQAVSRVRLSIDGGGVGLGDGRRLTLGGW